MQVSDPARTEKFEKYVGAGMAEQRAREKALERTLWATISNFFETYEEFLEATVWLEDDGTHQEIIANIEEKIRRGLDSHKAVKRVLPKHKHQFESLFEYKSDDEDDSGTMQTVSKMAWIIHPRSVRAHFRLIKDIRTRTYSRRLPFAHARSLKITNKRFVLKTNPSNVGPFFAPLSHIVIKLVEQLLILGKISQTIEGNNQNRWNRWKIDKIDKKSIKSIKINKVDKIA